MVPLARDSPLVLSFVPTEDTALEHFCCLAANLSCTKLPWSASAGVWTTQATVASNPVFPNLTPITGAEDLASGLVSNAFRRNAACNFGRHTTPAPFFTISSHGCPTSKASSEEHQPCRCLRSSLERVLRSGFDTRSLAVPPPHFDLHVHSRGCPVWSEIPR